MRLTIIRMLSNSSLSAFSNSNAVRSTGTAASVQRVRSLSEQPQAGGTASAAPAKSLDALPTIQPGRTMPRGSLLDLSV